jgi:hypothetical protein
MQYSNRAFEIALNTFTTGNSESGLTLSEIRNLPLSKFDSYVYAADSFVNFSTEELMQHIAELAADIEHSYLPDNNDIEKSQITKALEVFRAAEKNAVLIAEAVGERGSEKAQNAFNTVMTVAALRMSMELGADAPEILGSDRIAKIKENRTFGDV